MADRLLATGLIGTIVTAIHCCTPVLMLLFGALGPAARRRRSA